MGYFKKNIRRWCKCNQAALLIAAASDISCSLPILPQNNHLLLLELCTCYNSTTVQNIHMNSECLTRCSVHFFKKVNTFEDLLSFDGLGGSRSPFSKRATFQSPKLPRLKQKCNQACIYKQPWGSQFKLELKDKLQLLLSNSGEVNQYALICPLKTHRQLAFFDSHTPSFGIGWYYVHPFHLWIQNPFEDLTQCVWETQALLQCTLVQCRAKGVRKRPLHNPEMASNSTTGCPAAIQRAVQWKKGAFSAYSNIFKEPDALYDLI